jgi:hypothetical protein
MKRIKVVRNIPIIDKYRFVITREESGYHDFGAYTTYHDEKICALDRKTGTSYCTKGKTSFYGKLLESYAEALENERTK